MICDKGLQHLALVAHGTPEIVLYAVHLHEHLVQVPAPAANRAHPFLPFPTDPCREHRPEALPPEPHRLMADLDPALAEQVLHIPQRQREALM